MTLSTLSSNLDAIHKLVNDAKPLDSKQIKLVYDAKPLDSKQMTHANPINSNYLDLGLICAIYHFLKCKLSCQVCTKSAHFAISEEK